MTKKPIILKKIVFRPIFVFLSPKKTKIGRRAKYYFARKFGKEEEERGLIFSVLCLAFGSHKIVYSTTTLYIYNICIYRVLFTSSNQSRSSYFFIIVKTLLDSSSPAKKIGLLIFFGLPEKEEGAERKEEFWLVWREGKGRLLLEFFVCNFRLLIRSVCVAMSFLFGKKKTPAGLICFNWSYLIFLLILILDAFTFVLDLLIWGLVWFVLIH